MSQSPDKPTPSSLRVSDLHGLSRLAVHGVTETVGLVEEMHYTISRISAPVGRVPPGRTRGITGLVYRSIRGVTGLVGGSIELAFERLAPEASSQDDSPRRQSTIAILNGVLGDHLDATANPLAIPMRLRHRGRALALDAGALSHAIEAPSPRLLIAIHGLCLADSCWGNPGEQTGEPAVDQQAEKPGNQPIDPPVICLPEAVARENGYTVLHLHYNTGRSIAANGRELTGLMEQLVDQWPVAVEEVALLGHSMGGLVSRSACHYADENDHRWPERLRRMVFLGTPHLGSPLERAGHVVDRLLNISPYSAPFHRLGRIRSTGITDLRHGRIVDPVAEPDQSSIRAFLPDHVDLHAIAATRSKHIDRPIGRLIGDGLVPIASALGHHPDPDLRLPIPTEYQRILPATSHIGLLHHPQVLETLNDWLR